MTHEEDETAEILAGLTLGDRRPRSSIVKLRLEGVPRWPKPGYKFFQWQYDWEAAMALIGIREIIKADINDENVIPADDALASRYLVASIPGHYNRPGLRANSLRATATIKSTRRAS